MSEPVTQGQPLAAVRAYFESGITLPYAFRARQLQLLKEAVLKYEDGIAAALHADLGKSREEAYAAETGLVLSAIRQARKNLRKWMKPQTVKTDLVNFPSSSRIYRDPLGVVFIIAPWNYPFQLLLIPLVGAIAGGNGVVLKPSELAPATAAIVENIIREIYPPEYVRVLQGEGAAVVPAAIASFRFDHIFYTGSGAVGKAVYQQAAKDMVPVTLELGGKSPAVVEADADLRVAARRIALGKFLNAGQTCVAPDYLLVHESVRERFTIILGETLVAFFGEDPRESPSYGKIINTHRFDILAAYLSEGRVLFGGSADRVDRYIAPTLIEGVSLDSPLMTQEIFGPILPLFGFGTDGEALAIIKRNPDPLAFYVFTSNKGKGRGWVKKINFGGGSINNASLHFTNPHLPFGGVGASGIGAYHGKYTFDTFTHAKPVMRTPVWFDPGIRYPPFQGKLKWIKRLIR
jgi:aldehyde dehydrogenase (NAD+)